LGAFSPALTNGDVIDHPYVKLNPSHRKILDRIKQRSLRQKLIWLQGNHDNGYIPDQFGKIVFKRSHCVGNRLLITHGDDFDEIMPRNQMFMKAFKLLHNVRVTLGARPVHVAEYAKKWKSFYKVLRKNVMINAVKCAIENG
jgi:UDP-2,3-diacylglucosamine pyrophosphatase LpxH